LRSLARLGFLLIAVHTLLRSGQSLVAVLAEAQQLGVEEPGSYLLYTSAAWLTFSFTPPVLLLLFSARLAAFLFPADPPGSAPPSPEAILTAGVAILGLYLVAVSLSGAVGSGLMGVITLTRNEGSALEWFSRAGGSLLGVAFGIVFFFYAGPLVHWLSSRWRAA
jgi:hypothetical protein